MKSAFHPEAREELLAAVDFYNQVESGLGLDFANEIQAAVDMIEAFPNAWTPVDSDLCRCLVRRFPYAILYAVERDVVMIYAVMHIHRDPDYWKSRRHVD